MEFGYLDNGELKILQPGQLIKTEIGFLITGNPELLLKYGYKQVVYNKPETKDGYRLLDFFWEENDTTINQIWNYEELPKEEELGPPDDYIEEPEEEGPTIEERVTAIEDCLLELILNA